MGTRTESKEFMKKEDAELKAKALRKDLVAREAEHKESGNKFSISSVEAMVDDEDETNYDVYCLLNPSENNFQTLASREPIDDFLANYKVLIALEAPKQNIAS